jgi:thiamine-phosphate pyrophosphorylase
VARLPPLPFVYPILDLALLDGRGVEDVAAALAAGGAGLLQVRGKGVADGALLDAVRRAQGVARARGLDVIVNDRPDVALAAGAAGVHVGQDDLPPAACRRLLGPAAIVGFSTHSFDQLVAAAREPVDYIAVGPVFATATKADAEAVVGTALLRAARAHTRLPLVAIGGITAANAALAVQAGADAVAVISAVLGGGDVAQRTRALRAAVAGAS